MSEYTIRPLSTETWDAFARPARRTPGASFNHRHEGVAAVAVQGALDLIAEAGGGVVEAYPQDTAGKKISTSFFYSATRSMFEKA